MKELLKLGRSARWADTLGTGAVFAWWLLAAGAMLL